MHILLTNDDGVHAPGLAALERIARSLGASRITVVAPEYDQSGVAHSLSLNDPLRLREIGPDHFAVKGTPTDCVIMAIHRIFEGRRPDLVLSGVNRGHNVAEDVTYSGTVAGAMEGTLLGVRSIALSQAYGFSEDGRIVPWDTAEELAPALLERLIGLELPNGVFLNVNFPNLPPEDIRGTVVTHQGKLVHGLWIDERKDGRGFPYFWLRFGRKEEEISEGSDQAALRDGYVSVSPLHLDLTAPEVAGRLAEALG